MTRYPIDPEEMARRGDEDLIASMKMIAEGGPDFDPFDKYRFGRSIEEEIEAKAEHEAKDSEEDLPETYQ